MVIAGKIASTGGIAALAIKKVGAKEAVNTNSAQIPSKEAHHE
jgi:hypothetical protein